MMPVYCYQCNSCNATEEVVGSMETSGQQVKCEDCGSGMDRDIVAEQAGGSNNSGNWPQFSTAAGVCAWQGAEAAAADKKLGVPTEYRKDGAAVFTSSKHKRAWLKKHQWTDRGAYS